MEIIQSILTKNDCYTTGRKIVVKGLMLHSVGCSQPKASVFINNWNRSGLEVCVHGFIDGLTGKVYQTLPWDHRGWHAGGSANNTHIGVEMCEPAEITYTGGASFTIKNETKAREVATRTYKSAVELYAMLCEQYKLDPLADGVIISHKEGHSRGVASNHGDPEHLWKQLKLPYTMDTFRADVKAAMKGQYTESGTKEDVTTYYLVQTGAFKNKANAEKQLEDLKAAGYKDAYITTKTVVTETKPVEPPKPQFAVGDVVKLTADATIYKTTRKYSSWVYKSKLYVRQIDGDRIVISTKKTGDVTGAVEAKHLVKA